MNLVGDGLCQLTLQGHYITQFSLVTFGPEVAIRSSQDELSVNAHTISGSDDGTFHDRVHLKLSGDFGQRLLGSFIKLRRSSGYNAERAKARQFGRQSVRHSICKVVL